MPKRSAGILMYRQPLAGIELLLVHPGGPLWARKDWGAWSIPKGEYAEDEDPLTVAKREFEEETGARPEGDFLGLGNIVQGGRKASFPEVDRAEWFSPAAARRKILPAQSEFIARLLTALARLRLASTAG